MRDFGFDEMTRLWDELSRSGAGLRGRGASADDGWTPAVDIYEREGTLVLVLDLPGMKRDEIALEVEANGIVVEGQRARPDQDRGLRLERPMGRFRRAFRIGVPIDPSQARASYRDGVLEITAPKADISGPRRVKIDVT